MHRSAVNAAGSAARRRLQALPEWYGEVVRTNTEDDDMKHISMMAATLLLVSACSQTPISGPSEESSDVEGTMCLSIGPSVGLILNPGSTNELPGLVTDAWREQETLDMPQLVRTATAQIKLHNPEYIEVTESWLSEIGVGRIDPEELVDAEFVQLLQTELEAIGLKFRIMQTETPVDQTIPMLLQDGTTQDMRLTVQKTILVQDMWIP